jgi:hypothetical protein
MTTIHHDLSASCPPDRIWALLSDLTAVQRYNPTVKSAEIRGAARTGIGAVRACELLPKGRVVERVTHWEEGRAVGLEVAESDWPIHYMRWVTRIEPTASGSRLTQQLDYAMKLGPLGWLMDNMMMKRKLSRTLDGVLARLIEQAEAVTRSTS